MAAALVGLVLALRSPPAPLTAVGFVDQSYTAADRQEYKYAVFVPPGYDPAEPLPLIVFLHASGAKGEDGRQPLLEGLGPVLRQSLEQPGRLKARFLAVFPQSRAGRWDPEAGDDQIALDALADATAKYAVDPGRVYLTGYGAGGTGTWRLAEAYPDRWAAIAPVGGRGLPERADQLVHVPCWCFHGGADRAVKPDASRAMVAALEKLGAKPRYTEYPGLEGNVWRKVYADPGLYDWLLRQRKPAG